MSGGRPAGAWLDGLSAESLRERMKARKLSQQAVADAVGVARSAVGWWLGGRCIPAPATQRRLIVALVGGGSVPAPSASPSRKVARPIAWLPKLGPEVLREHLWKSGLTHSAYCDAHGFTLSALQTWLSGQKAPVLKTQRRMLSILRKSEAPTPVETPAPSGELAPVATASPAERLVLCPTCKGTGEFSLTPEELRDLIARRHAEAST